MDFSKSLTPSADKMHDVYDLNKNGFLPETCYPMDPSYHGEFTKVLGDVVMQLSTLLEHWKFFAQSFKKDKKHHAPMTIQRVMRGQVETIINGTNEVLSQLHAHAVALKSFPQGEVIIDGLEHVGKVYCQLLNRNLGVCRYTMGKSGTLKVTLTGRKNDKLVPFSNPLSFVDWLGIMHAHIERVHTWFQTNTPPFEFYWIIRVLSGLNIATQWVLTGVETNNKLSNVTWLQISLHSLRRSLKSDCANSFGVTFFLNTTKFSQELEKVLKNTQGDHMLQASQLKVMLVKALQRIYGMLYENNGIRFQHQFNMHYLTCYIKPKLHDFIKNCQHWSVKELKDKRESLVDHLIVCNFDINHNSANLPDVYRNSEYDLPRLFDEVNELMYRNYTAISIAIISSEQTDDYKDLRMLMDILLMCSKTLLHVFVFHSMVENSKYFTTHEILYDVCNILLQNTMTGLDSERFTKERVVTVNGTVCYRILKIHDLLINTFWCLIDVLFERLRTEDETFYNTFKLPVHMFRDKVYIKDEKRYTVLAGYTQKAVSMWASTIRQDMLQYIMHTKSMTTEQYTLSLKSQIHIILSYLINGDLGDTINKMIHATYVESCVARIEDVNPKGSLVLIEMDPFIKELRKNGAKLFDNPRWLLNLLTIADQNVDKPDGRDIHKSTNTVFYEPIPDACPILFDPAFETADTWCQPACSSSSSSPPLPQFEAE